MKQQELLPHLFRTESRKITAVLCKRFGMELVDMAEDIVSDTFLAAAETWSYQGFPENPVAWLYTVAKNKALNRLRREKLFRDTLAAQPNHGAGEIAETDIDLTETNISDSQLQMLFAICQPVIPPESQIGLALRILCGFSIGEIATAFLVKPETIHKRLGRAKEKLRAQKVRIEFPPETEISPRLERVLTTLYLLFNEGYYSESKEGILREELCFEAMRLACLLTENERTDQPPVNALLALMCFHASRFGARKNESGEFVLYDEQDETQWDPELIARGAYYLHRASRGNTLSSYHLEAAIAWWHTKKADTKEKWEQILQLYNQLLVTAYSPMAALNRTYALSKVYGPAAAVKEAEKLNLTGNHFYFTLLGELYKETDRDRAREHFKKAIALAKTQTEKQSLQKKMDRL